MFRPQIDAHETYLEGTTMTNDDVKAGLRVALEVAGAIREAGSLADGELYAVLMGRMSFDAYESLKRLLVGQGLVRIERDRLVWAGGF